MLAASLALASPEFYRYSIRTRIKTIYHFSSIWLLPADSIAIPLEQGLRQNGIRSHRCRHRDSIAIPLEQGLRPKMAITSGANFILLSFH